MSEGADAVGTLETAIGHRFADRALAETALAHPSFAHEVDGSRGNERTLRMGYPSTWYSSGIPWLSPGSEW